MKLGDNMAPVEAANPWGEVHPTRKTRPPRIGEIPRHVAVDEESPNSSSRQLPSQVKSTQDISSQSPERYEVNLNSEKSPEAVPERIVPVDRRPLPEKNKPRSESTVRQSSVISTILSVRDKLSDSLGDIVSRHYFRESRTEPLKRVSVKKIAEDVVEDTRKDSAICLEESEELATLKERLIGDIRLPLISTRISRLSSSQRDDDNPDEEGRTYLKSLAKYCRPRRESSGYFSNLSTFDEDRRNSTTDVLQGLSSRRRSSTKRFSRFNREESTTADRMPTTEIYRKVSTAGIEMPNIDELKEIRDPYQGDDYKGLSKFDAFPEIPRERRRSVKKSIFDKLDDNESDLLCKRITAIEMPNIDEGREPSDIEKQRSDEAAEWKTAIVTGNKSPGDQYKDALTDLEDSHLLRICRGDRDESQEYKETEEMRQRIVAMSESLRDEVLSSPRSRQRKKLVHQFSSPSASNVELERIPERPSEIVESTLKNTVVVVNTPDTSSSSFEDRRDDGDETTSRESEDPRKGLPKSIKVYQLLSTQSEDRGDGEPRLMDRRISLQITKQEDEDEAAPIVLPPPEDKKLLHADSVPLLKLPEQQAAVPVLQARGLSPIRKLSSPGEVGLTQRLLADNGNVGVRPIYPYCPYSPYGSPQGSPHTRRRPLRESRRVSIDNRQGALQLNQYKLLDNIGQGSFGIVKLAYNEEDETHYAMKILSKKKLMKKAGIFGRMAPGRKGATNPLAKVYREIALLKKLDHPNVVKLVEVLDDPDEDNLYLVFELVQKGEVIQLPTDKPLDEETARINFRDVVMGVEYLHYQRIVHRDIKPSNLLVDSEGRVKVADLGVSAELRASGELLTGSAGTPAFAAPETTTPGAQYSGTLCDVWSMGVTLYSLVTGRLPWDGSGSIIGVQAAVRTEPLRFPDKPELSAHLRDLITHMLAKDPAMRCTLADVKCHHWVTNHDTEPLPSETDNCRLPVTVTDEEVARVVTRVPKLDTLILIKTMLKQHSFQNPFLPKRIVKSATRSDGMSTGLKTSSNADGKQNRDAIKSKTEQFYKAGRSNSAPDSYEWQTNGRQVSMDMIQLPPLKEAVPEMLDAEKR